MIRRRVVVRGRVHGVGFRVSCAERARARGLAGWVRNRADGTVEAVFEGEADAVEAIVAWCDEVEVFEEQPDGLGGFASR